MALERGTRQKLLTCRESHPLGISSLDCGAAPRSLPPLLSLERYLGFAYQAILASQWRRTRSQDVRKVATCQFLTLKAPPCIRSQVDNHHKAPTRRRGIPKVPPGQWQSCIDVRFFLLQVKKTWKKLSKDSRNFKNVQSYGFPANLLLVEYLSEDCKYIQISSAAHGTSHLWWRQHCWQQRRVAKSLRNAPCLALCAETPCLPFSSVQIHSDHGFIHAIYVMFNHSNSERSELVGHSTRFDLTYESKRTPFPFSTCRSAGEA